MLLITHGGGLKLATPSMSETHFSHGEISSSHSYAAPLESILQCLDPRDSACRPLPERQLHILGQFTVLYKRIMFLSQTSSWLEKTELRSKQDRAGRIVPALT